MIHSSAKMPLKNDAYQHYIFKHKQKVSTRLNLLKWNQLNASTKHATFLQIPEGPKFITFPQPASPTMIILNCFSTPSSSESDILSDNQWLLYSTNIRFRCEHSASPLQHKVSKLQHTLHQASIMNVTGGTCTDLTLPVKWPLKSLYPLK